MARVNTFALGGCLVIDRLGFGAMRITGPGVLGDPPDRSAARLLLRRALELGVNLIDTADSYGPEVARTSSVRPSIPIRTISSSLRREACSVAAPTTGAPMAGPTT